MNKRNQQPRRQWRQAQQGEVRVVGDGSERQFDAIVCVYGVTDDYGTMWMPGCFTASLTRKLPKCVYHHQWSEPIGRVVSFDDTTERLQVRVQLDDFAAVPRARQVWVQLQAGEDGAATLDEFSFGFMREEWTISANDEDEWAERMIRAQLDEVSPVLVGAVPGTKTLAVRSVDAEGTVDVQQAAQLATRLAAGDIDLAEALTSLKEAAEPAGPPQPPENEPSGDELPGEDEPTPEEQAAAEEAERLAQAEAEEAAAALAAEAEEAEAAAALAVAGR